MSNYYAPEKQAPAFPQPTADKGPVFPEPSHVPPSYQPPLNTHTQQQHEVYNQQPQMHPQAQAQPQKPPQDQDSHWCAAWFLRWALCRALLLPLSLLLMPYILRTMLYYYVDLPNTDIVLSSSTRAIMFSNSFWVLLVLVRSTSSLPIPIAAVTSLPFIVCLSVIPSSLVFLFIAKVIYIKNRRIESIHRPKLHLPILVGFLGSPDWEIKIKKSVDKACMVERHVSPSGSDSSWPTDEFGAHYSRRRISIYSRSLLPDLPPLAHISTSPRRRSRRYVPMLATSEASFLSLDASSDSSTRVRLVSVNSQDSSSFLPVVSKPKQSPLSQTINVLERNIVVSPQQTKTKYGFYRKCHTVPFLPIQTPPDSPLSRVESSEIQSPVFHFDDSKQAYPLVVHRMSHPYGAKATYDFPRSPQPSYENSPNYSESPNNRARSRMSSPATSSRFPNTATRALINNSPFFSSVSTKTYSDKKLVESAPNAIPLSSATVATVSNKDSLASETVKGIQDVDKTQNLAVNCQRGLGILTSADSTEETVGSDPTAKRKRKRPSPLFSIPEEDMQSRSSKSFKRFSSANSTATWRNSCNTTSGDVGITFTAVSVPSARSGMVDEDHLFVEEADDDEEGSRACLIGLLEELEEWGCEWVENNDIAGPPAEVGRAL